MMAAALAALVGSCAPKKPAGPPQDLLDEIAAAEAVYQELSSLTPSAQDSAAYTAVMGEAKAKMEAGDYQAAMGKARLAHLEAEKLYGKLVYDELMKYHPSTPFTYQYRKQMKDADDAAKAGNITAAIAAAQEGRRQAGLALDLQKQCLADAKQRLGEIKGVIESLYKPDYELIVRYWDAVDSLSSLDCDKTRKMVDDVARWADQFKRNTISMDRIFYVSAPFDYIKMYGDPYMYSDITEDGKLKNRVNQVSVGTQVKFIRCSLFSRDKTFYLVEDPKNGIQGWMAEERVWPERAVQH
jgi:hypothetical protein